MSSRFPYRSSVGRVLGSLLLNLAAIGGALCLVLVALAFFFHISLIMFKTGSMSPTIPAGSVAVIREIPAEQLSAGQIITVDRPGKLPVTHRVVNVTPGSHPDERMVRLKGDANETEDIAPYPVRHAGLVLWHAPGLAQVLMWFSRPWLMGLLTFAAGMLVTWSFWPRNGGHHLAENEDPDIVDHTPLDPHSCRRSGTGRHMSRGVCLFLGTALAASPLVTPHPPTAQATSTDTHIVGQYLRVTSVSDRQSMFNLAPGDVVDWQVGIAAEAPSPGQLRVGYDFTGRHALPLEISTKACSVRWQEDKCPGTQVPASHIEQPSWGSSGLLLSFGSHEQRWIKVSVRVPPRSTTPQGAVTVLRLIISGAGEELSASPNDKGPETWVGSANSASDTRSSAIGTGRPELRTWLPSTGTDILAAFFCGVAAVICGIAVTLFAGALKRRSERG